MIPVVSSMINNRRQEQDKVWIRRFPFMCITRNPAITERKKGASPKITWTIHPSHHNTIYPGQAKDEQMATAAFIEKFSVCRILILIACSLTTMEGERWKIENCVAFPIWRKKSTNWIQSWRTTNKWKAFPVKLRTLQRTHKTHKTLPSYYPAAPGLSLQCQTSPGRVARWSIGAYTRYDFSQHGIRHHSRNKKDCQ